MLVAGTVPWSLCICILQENRCRRWWVGWGGDDDVLCTCTHVTCYATDGVMAWRRHKSFSQNSISLALGKHRRSKVTKVEKRASFGLWKKTWFCHAATRNYMQFCNRMCLLLTATWRRRDLLVYQSAKYTWFLLLLIWWHGLFPSLSTKKSPSHN